MQQPIRLLSNELGDQQEGKATRWAAFCFSADSCSVSERVFIPDSTPVLVTDYYNIDTKKTGSTSNLCVVYKKVSKRNFENRLLKSALSPII